MSGTIDYSFDHASGIVRVKGVGLWSAAQVNAHFAELAETLRRRRAERRAIRVLVDLTEGGVQSGEVAELIKNGTHEMYREGDRIAMLVSSTIVKMQMRRVVDTRIMQLFVSAKAAEIWLAAYDEAYRAA